MAPDTPSNANHVSNAADAGSLSRAELQQRVHELELHVNWIKNQLDLTDIHVKHDESAIEPTQTPHNHPQDQPHDQPTGRRNFFKLAGVTATAFAIGAARAEPAAALDGSSILQGDSAASNLANTANSMTTLTSNGLSDVKTAAFKAVGPANSNGLWGKSNGAKGSGVLGESDSGFGVSGQSSTGVDLFAAGSGRIGLVAHRTTGLPTEGSYGTGEIFMTAAGELYVCVTGGSAAAGGQAEFRRISSRTDAGQLNLAGGTRIFDTRSAVDPGGVGVSGDRVLNGQSVTISAANYVPVGTKAILVNLGFFGAVRSGYLVSSTNPGGAGPISALWSAGVNGLISTVLPLNASRQFSIATTINDATPGPGAILSFDLVGYYL
jgi:hypothetical protein